MGAGHEADGANDVSGRQIFRHVKHFVDSFAGPIGVAKFFESEEQNAAAGVFCGTEKFPALFV
jgi:hypothetical protein